MSKFKPPTSGDGCLVYFWFAMFAGAKRCGSCGLLGPICVLCLGKNHTFCGGSR